MSWFSRLLGRPTHDDYYDQPGDFVLPAATSSEPRYEGDLPAFRPSQGRVFVHGEHADVDQVRTSIREAFRPSQPVSDRTMFAGRRELLRDLIVAIEDQRLHFVLYGDRGIGKTSILRVLSGLAEDAGYIVCNISGSESLTFSDFARRVAQRIPLLLHSDFEPGSPEIEQGLHLSDVLPEGPIDVSSFGEQLAKLSDAQLIIMLDEFDRVEARTFRASIAELIKNLSDHAAPTQLLIAGVASDLSELIAQIPSIRRNVLGVMVPNMTDAEVGEILDKAEQRSALTFSEDARNLIELASVGLPYLVGLVAQHAAFIATARGELEVSKRDVREAIVKARGELAGRIAARTLFAIEEAARQDQLMDLGKVAFSAMRGGGLFPQEMLTEKLRAFNASTSEDATLLVPLEDDPIHRWQFADDGAATYLWLSALGAE